MGAVTSTWVSVLILSTLVFCWVYQLPRLMRQSPPYWDISQQDGGLYVTIRREYVPTRTIHYVSFEWELSHQYGCQLYPVCLNILLCILISQTNETIPFLQIRNKKGCLCHNKKGLCPNKKVSFCLNRMGAVS